MTASPLSENWPGNLARLVATEPLGGGWVGTTLRGTLSTGQVVIIKQSPFPAAIEADGLAALARAGVPTPEVLAVQDHLLVLEFVSGTSDWPGLGLAIARMHRFSGDRYGWHMDNQAGRFLQPNAWSDDWPSFYVTNRILTHLADPNVPEAVARRLRRACDGPIQEKLPTRPIPSLTHGDFWTGNTVDGHWVIDPEVSFADRELDLAYMLTPSRHPLPPDFWEAYSSAWPIADDFAERRLVLGLHHQLLQIRHFGASQVPAIERDLTAMGW